MTRSLRDLMRREKESRKRAAPEPEEGSKPKLSKTSQPEGADTTPADQADFRVAKPASSAQKSPEVATAAAATTESAHANSGVPGSSDDGEFKVPLPLNLTRRKEQPPAPAPDFERVESEEAGGAAVLEETYELLEDEEFLEDAPELDSGRKSPAESAEAEEPEAAPEEREGEALDDNRLVYEQLNTALCSNLDYEHASILRDAGVEDAHLLEALDAEAQEKQDRSVITSANFGASGLSVSASQNLPVGFFDDRNVDAKARGKLTEKEVHARIRELSRKRSSYLSEAKYIQEKFMESFRERRRLESDLQELSESQRRLEDRLSEIKGDLELGADAELEADAQAGVASPRAGDAQRLAAYENLDYDDLSWMSRSII